MSYENPGEIPPTKIIFCIRWEYRRINASILVEANTTSIEAMVMQNQLRWAGHCIRMSDNRLLRQVLFAQLTHGMRTRDGKRNRFKDTAKYYMKKGQIDINVWEHVATDRPLWRRSIYHATANFEINLYFTRQRHVRGERRGRCLNIFTSPFHLAGGPHCNNICRSRIGLLSHLMMMMIWPST